VIGLTAILVVVGALVLVGAIDRNVARNATCPMHPMGGRPCTPHPSNPRRCLWCGRALPKS
jgi:hypothetical protein